MNRIMTFILPLFAAVSLYAQDEALETAPADTDSVSVTAAADSSTEPAVTAEEPPQDSGEAVAVKTAVPDTSKPKIAVYVTGGKDDGENKVFGTYILDAFIKSDRFIAIERSEAFLDEIDKEQVKQRSGAIDDAEISRLGKQSGVQYICVADITPAMKTYQVSARILDVETAKVITVGVAESQLNTLDELRAASAGVVYAMFAVLWPNDYPPPPPPKRKITFGCRVAYNNSYVNDMTLTMAEFDGHKLSYHDYANKLGAGHGFEFGVTAAYIITEDFSLEAGGNIAYRRPVNMDVADVSEFALTFPILVRWNIPGSLFFVQGGAVIDVPIKAMIKWEDKAPADFDARAPIDFGFILGGGFQINKNFSADLRITAGLREFDRQQGHLTFQASVGAGYMY
ncbi:hypothetical protein R80B4_01383 [Fibrobacteres bacterium R8-0-B4]